MAPQTLIGARWEVRATLHSHLARPDGVAACVQGMRRYNALHFGEDGNDRLLKELDGDLMLLEADRLWRLGGTSDLRLPVQGEYTSNFVDGREVVKVVDADRLLTSGGIALVCAEGRLTRKRMELLPVL